MFPERSPMPSAEPWSLVAPASSAASADATPNPRSLCPCQSTPASTPTSATTVFANRTTAVAPAGVAWPTVSATHRRDAPLLRAVENSARSDAGSARVVSSVTNITVSPWPTANRMAASLMR